MKIKFKIFSLLYFLSFLSFSQEKNDFDFIGALTLENNALITYRIQFNINNKDEIKGFSFTDINGKHETKSIINGSYDKKKKLIKFKESDILYTKSKEIADIFCFINIEGKIKFNKNKHSINGSFVGLYNNKDTCATGKVLLLSLKTAFSKIEKVSKKINRIKKIDSITKEKFTTTKFLNDITPNTLKKDEVLSVFWKSDRLILEIWDNGKEDGDMISLTFNNKTIFRKYKVKKVKKLIELDLIKGENSIEILANNNGRISPNTAKVILVDGETKHLISTHLEAGKSSKINIIYKPK